MKISNEARVGIIGIVTIAVLIWGINYLKGRNIFSSTYTLYTFFSQSGGLEKSSPVLINGIKVGYIDDLQLRTRESPPVKAALSIEKQYKVGNGSFAELVTKDLLGSKVIRIVPSGELPPLGDRDTIPGLVEPDMISKLESELYPIFDKISILATALDSLAIQMNSILSQEALSQIIENLADLTYSLKGSLASGGSLDESFRHLEAFTMVLEEEKDEMASLITNLNSISESLKQAGLDSLSAQMTSAFSQVDLLMKQINTGEGSAGKLLYSDTLYENLNVLIADLDSLVRDLKENPKDYVQVSVFGKSKK